MIQFSQLPGQLNQLVWKSKLASLPKWQAYPIKVLRIVWLVIRDLAEGQLGLRAMSLVYTTLLSLVPLLAVSFSVLKAFEVHNQIEPALLNFLAPLGEKGIEITARVIEFVDNIRVGVLGAVGLGLLFYTVIALIQKVERAFNYTWRVTQSRTFVERFSDYLSVLMIGPVLVFSALGATASFMNTSLVQNLAQLPVLGWLIDSVGTLIPYFFVIAAFTFVYIFVPNTRVRFGSALVGALVAGILWQTIGWGFASFVVTSAKYAAIYSGFAILVIFMIWIYIAWLILLVGASIAFYHQHPEYLVLRRRELQLSNRFRERLGVMAMYLIVKNHFEGATPWTTERLAKQLLVPTQELKGLLSLLQSRGLLIPTGIGQNNYLPAQAPENVPVTVVIDALRGGAYESDFAMTLEIEEPVEAVLLKVEESIHQAVEGLSLRDLVVQDSARG